MLRRDDRDDSVYQPTRETLQRPRSQGRPECGGVSDVEEQLDPRIRRVHALPAWSRRAREPPDQLELRDNAGADSKRTRHETRMLRFSNAVSTHLPKADQSAGVRRGFATDPHCATLGFARSKSLINALICR